MLNLIINNKEVAIKDGTSFDLSFDNPLFTDAEGYSFNIEVPLRGCPGNIAIFGAINTPDAVISTTRYDATLILDNNIMYGACVITSVNQSQLTLQFLTGKSADNYSSAFDDIIVSNLNLGTYKVDGWAKGVNIEATKAWKGPGEVKAVALPWVNDNTGTLLNPVRLSGNQFIINSIYVAPLPYLYWITADILATTGYTVNLEEWRSSPEFNLVLCHQDASPGGVTNVAKLLPEWSLTEFLQNIELLLYGEFVIDHARRTITFRRIRQQLDKLPVADLSANLVDDFTVDVSERDESGFSDNRQLEFPQRSDIYWPTLNCPQVIEYFNGHYREYTDYSMWLRDNNQLLNFTPDIGWSDDPQSDVNKFHSLVHIADSDTWLTYKCARTYKQEGETVDRQQNEPVILNAFGPSNRTDNSNESGGQTVAFVPAYINDVDNGRTVFINAPAESDTPIDEEAGNVNNPDAYWRKTTPMMVAEDESDTGSPWNELSVAYYDGTRKNLYRIPLPIIMPMQFSSGWEAVFTKYSLRLTDRARYYPGRIVPKIKYNFEFIADTMPDVRSVFKIRGHYYLCRKLSCKVDSTGASQLFKGEFYRYNLP